MLEHVVSVFAAVFGLLGTVVLASRGPLAGWGFVFYLASNGGWLAFSLWREVWPLFLQTLGFTASSVWGVWVWLVQPWLRSRSAGDSSSTGEQSMRVDELELASEPGALLEQIQTLRRDFCASVTLVCDDDETGHTAIEVMAEWTGWTMKRYEGKTLAECLARAMAARRAAQGGAA